MCMLCSVLCTVLWCVMHADIEVTAAVWWRWGGYGGGGCGYTGRPGGAQESSSQLCRNGRSAVSSLPCFDAVGWLSGEASSLSCFMFISSSLISYPFEDTALYNPEPFSYYYVANNNLYRTLAAVTSSTLNLWNTYFPPYQDGCTVLCKITWPCEE